MINVSCLFLNDRTGCNNENRLDRDEGIIQVGEKNRRCADAFAWNGGRSVGVRIFFEREREKQFGKNRSTDHDVGVMLHLVNSELRVILVINQLIMKLGELGFVCTCGVFNF
ncbi:hypothetical protein FXO38_01605 [Capsicum annuum]|nr:hypothetical protein FXO37_13271 [Capsicum annuum]KAF3681631.1 hypothetical protein FXO38_01605 [Capsicum annuum]